MIRAARVPSLLEAFVVDLCALSPRSVHQCRLVVGDIDWASFGDIDW